MLELLGFFLICLVPVAAMVGSLIWSVRNNTLSRRSGQRLAAAMGLQPLNKSPNGMAVWYGGWHAGHEFALRPFGKTERQPGFPTSATFWLRIVMAVYLPEPMGINVLPGPKVASGNPKDINEAFRSEYLDRLPESVREAMFDFVRKGYPNGLSGTTYRLSKGARTLLVHDRATAPDWLGLDPFVLPEATVVVIHDHYDMRINRDASEALMDDLAAVARMIESIAVEG